MKNFPFFHCKECCFLARTGQLTIQLFLRIIQASAQARGPGGNPAFVWIHAITAYCVFKGQFHKTPPKLIPECIKNAHKFERKPIK